MPDGISRQQMAAQYGFALAFMESNPELLGLFNQAVKGTWSADRFVAKLRNTDWFQNHSANVRNAILQQTSDPATWEANVNQMYATVRDAYGGMFGTAGMNGTQLRAWAETATRMGWSEAQLMDRIVRATNVQKTLRSDALGGTAAQVNASIDSLSAAYGVKYSKEWKARQVSRVLRGDDTAEGLQQRIVDRAMRQYGAFADRLAAGETVMDVADPYVQQMADLLEMNPADININSKMIQKALRQRTKDGNPAAMNMDDFEQLVRKDKRWQFTSNAREEMSSLVAQLGQAFGVMA